MKMKKSIWIYAPINPHQGKEYIRMQRKKAKNGDGVEIEVIPRKNEKRLLEVTVEVEVMIKIKLPRPNTSQKIE